MTNLRRIGPGYCQLLPSPQINLPICHQFARWHSAGWQCSAILPTTLPEVEYSKYKAQLDDHHIHYATAIQDFPKNFFVKKISMPDGAVKDFLCNIKAIIKKKRKRLIRAKKLHQEAEKENTEI